MACLFRIQMLNLCNMPFHCAVYKLATHYIYQVVIPINTFVLLCSIQTLQLLSMHLASKKPCTYVLVEEIIWMLDLLITQSSGIGQSTSFPQPIYTEVAKSLNPRKTLMVSFKFQMVLYFSF